MSSEAVEAGAGGEELAAERQRRQLAERRLRAALAALKTSRDGAKAEGTDTRELLAVANHQMRGPLSSVLTVFSLLSDSVLTEEQNEWVLAGLDSARTLHYQINQLAELARLERRAVELEEAEVAVADLLDDVADLCLSRAQARGTELFARLDPEAAQRLVCDVGRVRQILIDLCMLALDAQPGGRVLLSAERCGDRLHLSAGAPAALPTAPGEDAVLAEGTPQENPSELGLLITRRLSELLGGEIRVRRAARASLAVEARLPWRPARQARDRHTLDLRAALGEQRIALLDTGGPAGGLLADTFARWGVRARRFRRASELLHARFEPDLVVAEGEDVAELRATARAGVRSVGILAQHGPAPELAALPEFLALHRLPASERELLTRLAQRDDQPMQDPGRSRIPRARHRCKVLVAEDNLANRMITTRLLEKLGHKVHGVADGQEAVSATRQLAFDVVLMDLRMPVLDGVEATRQILADDKVQTPPPVIALTGDGSAGRREECLRVGMQSFLEKPVDPRALAEAVDEWGHRTQLDRLRRSLSSHEVLPLVDRAVLARMGKEVDVSLIPDVGAQFLAELDECVNKAQAAFEAGDPARIRASLRPLRSTAASFGARQLAALLRQIDQLATGTERELLGEFVALLGEVASRTAERLAREMSSLGH